VTVRITNYRVDDLEEAKSPGREVPADETLRFTFGGAEYEIDLTKENAAKFRKKMEPYTQAARKTRGRYPQRTQAHRVRSADIRQWARDHGREVSERGRIPASVVAAYEQDTGRKAA
jgi:hypothetical protein